MNGWIKKTLITFLVSFFSGLAAQTIKIAAAANVENPVQEIAQEFTIKTGIKTDLIFASSGKLTAQIKNGAPFDVFISADSTYPNSLYTQKLALKPREYAIGILALWTTHPLNISRGFSVLEDATVEKISIPNPDFAPYGRAAMEAIKKQSLSLTKDIIKKLVYAESVSQSNQYIQTGSVDAGFTSLSSVLDPRLSNPGKYWIVDASLYSPIGQFACILDYGKKNHTEQSQKFFDFLFSKDARKIFLKYGYKMHE